VKEEAQVVSVSLCLPPGDYSNIPESTVKKMQVMVSSDMVDIMKASEKNTTFYVIARRYFSERKGLYKVIECNTSLEASIKATLTCMRTDLALSKMSFDENELNTPVHVIEKAIEYMEDVLDSEESMEAFDKKVDEVCHLSESIVIDKGGEEGEFQIDSHIEAKS
jgi:ATP phosphoribosyltransferase|tara:strand:+ start:935 stop:1429 length:495 start_codon:yes stop_codon:yes gene_type:complete